MINYYVNFDVFFSFFCVRIWSRLQVNFLVLRMSLCTFDFFVFSVLMLYFCTSVFLLWPTFSKVELTFSKVVLIPAGLLKVEFRVDPRLKVEFRGVDTLAKKKLT